MRFDQATVPLVPRTTLNCLDMGFEFIRRNFVPLTGLWGSIAGPLCLATYFYVDRLDGSWWSAFVVFYFGTVVMATAVTTAVALSAFGERLTVQAVFRRLFRVGWQLIPEGIFWRLLTALGLVCAVVPGLYVALRTSFSVEKRVLSNLGRHLHDRRTSELLQGELGDLGFRAFGILMFGVFLWGMLILTIDFISTYLFGFPILWGRLNVDIDYLGDPLATVDYIVDFLWRDPAIVTTGLAAALMAYVPCRLAWFFCYIDVRVRRDCWDMELEILREAERLEAA